MCALLIRAHLSIRVIIMEVERDGQLDITEPRKERGYLERVHDRYFHKFAPGVCQQVDVSETRNREERVFLKHVHDRYFYKYIFARESSINKKYWCFYVETLTFSQSSVSDVEFGQHGYYSDQSDVRRKGDIVQSALADPNIHTLTKRIVKNIRDMTAVLVVLYNRTLISLYPEAFEHASVVDVDMWRFFKTVSTLKDATNQVAHHVFAFLPDQNDREKQYDVIKALKESTVGGPHQEIRDRVKLINANISVALNQLAHLYVRYYRSRCA